MRVLRSGVDPEVSEKRISEARLGQHAFNGVLQEEFGLPSEGLYRIGETLSSRIAGVSRVDLVGHLLTREPYFVDVDNDDVVTAIHMRRKAGFVLAAEDLGHLRGKTSQNLPFRIDDDPFFVDRLGVSGDCFVTL